MQPLSCLGAWAEPMLCADLAGGPRTAAASGSRLHRLARGWFPSSRPPLEGSAALAMEERGASRGQGCPHNNPEGGRSALHRVGCVRAPSRGLNSRCSLSQGSGAQGFHSE